jgi:hypothetical protein
MQSKKTGFGSPVAGSKFQFDPILQKSHTGDRKRENSISTND